MNDKTIGKRIQELRKEKGLTQKQLAEEVGVTPQAVSKWETDESCPDISVLPSLAATLGVSVDELLGADTRDNQKSGVIEAEDADGEDTVSDVVEDKINKKFSFEWNAGKIAGIVFGIFVIFAGVLLILTKTNPGLFGDITFWDILWPSALIFLGLPGFFSKEFSVFSAALVTVGAVFLLKNLKLIDFNVWPFIVAILLIVIGIYVIIKAVIRKRRKYTAEGSGKLKSDFSEKDGKIKYNASFGDDKAVSKSEKIIGGDMSVSFGEFTLDLSKVKEFDENAAINVKASFGEAVIILPKNVAADINYSGSFSGKSVQGEPSENAPYKLAINASVSFGNVTVRYD